ncbi:pre-mrna-splicing factor [Nannochloropsis oceanica]
MTTAAKSTWNSKQGGASDLGSWSLGGQTSRQFSVLDMPAHKTLKYRKTGQNTAAELRKKDLRSVLDEKERAAHMAKLQERGKGGDLGAREELRRLEAGEAAATPLLLKDKEELRQATQRFDDRDDEANDDDDDAGGVGGTGIESDLDSSDDSDDDDDDDDEDLLRLELEKIKQEREEARRKQEDEDKAEAARMKEDEINAAALKGNPLLASGTGSAQIKRKWNDDVVFKNQSRGETEKKKKFVNDTIRNPFHKAFLQRYMK